MPNLENSSDSRDGRPAADGTDRVVLRAEGVEKTYGTRLPFGHSVEVLTGASLAVWTGELVGIVGENGSGKSTLLETLVGTLDADAGTVERPGTVGWCPQEPQLYERLTVRETFDLFGEGYGLTGDEVAEARDRLADRLGFEEFLDRRVDRLSGGNRQKVNLSVALLHDPDVLLLDEPYTGFDWETYLAFWDLAESLADRGVAVVVISHFVEDRDRFDRVLELRDGRLHEDDAAGTEAADDPANGAAGDRQGVADGAAVAREGVR